MGTCFCLSRPPISSSMEMMLLVLSVDANHCYFRFVYGVKLLFDDIHIFNLNISENSISNVKLTILEFTFKGQGVMHELCWESMFTVQFITGSCMSGFCLATSQDHWFLVARRWCSLSCICERESSLLLPFCLWCETAVWWYRKISFHIFNLNISEN